MLHIRRQELLGNNDMSKIMKQQQDIWQFYREADTGTRHNKKYSFQGYQQMWMWD
uniref:Uncharacterized protein n=1 Tax=Arion vulgaris TaxID=1028688 RepID=A0A0B6YQ63_9EUPU